MAETTAPTASAPAVDDGLIALVQERNRKAIARAMAVAESTAPGARQFVAAVHRLAGHAHTIGITGVPGSGKSTMVRALGQRFRATGRTVGIVAIDPSSPFSGGAILGDRIRMNELSGDPGVFIRSMATRGALGGLARSTLDVVDVLDAARFDVVLIETVGVGQDEVDVVQAAHTVLVVSAPGLGDEVQAIKAGVLEIADIHVVSKCDKPDARQTVADLKAMLRLGGIGRGDTTWSVEVLPTSAQNRDGIDALVDAIDRHRAHLAASGELEARQRKIMEMRIVKTAEDIVRDELGGRRRDALHAVLSQAVAKDTDPYTAARGLLREIATGL
ncbi:MAG: methylmalonyl Co-A mutase-associated GTPase MeaB [Rhodospirillales bacterium]|nr:MAG: methylmalonyl Co-A mutase-associated GTPase MeaB [Rhodospirillales bacterium]